jgi:hypothetical protein
MWTFLLVSGAIGLIAYRFNNQIKAGVFVASRAAAPFTTKLLPVPVAYRQVLHKYFPYYQKLSVADQEIFERKVCLFMYGKRFVPRNVETVTLEAKVLIAATAIQLTFGLSEIYLRHFRTILVYPTDYYSTITRRFHRGEVNPMFGIIVLSWQSFVDGFIHTDSGVNLGLHELAHALRLENIIRNEEYQFFDEGLLKKLDALAYSVCHTAEETSEMLLRPYACANEHEFFAVAVENFFERPVMLKATMPDLYNILKKLLNQDPVMMQV